MTLEYLLKLRLCLVVCYNIPRVLDLKINPYTDI